MCVQVKILRLHIHLVGHDVITIIAKHQDFEYMVLNINIKRIQFIFGRVFCQVKRTQTKRCIDETARHTKTE